MTNPIATDYEKLIEKINKIMALAENNPNPNEAAVAAAKVSELLAEYNLTIEQVKGDKKQEDIVIMETIRSTDGRNAEQWKINFMGILADYNFCRFVISGNIYFKIIGRRENVETVINLFQKFVDILELGAQVDFFHYKNGGGFQHGKTYKNSFLLGACHGFKSALQNKRDELNNKPGGMGLVVARKEENDEFVNATFSKLGKRKAPPVRFSHDAYNNGFTYGSKVGQ